MLFLDLPGAARHLLDLSLGQRPVFHHIGEVFSYERDHAVSVPKLLATLGFARVGGLPCAQVFSLQRLKRLLQEFVSQQLLGAAATHCVAFEVVGHSGNLAASLILVAFTINDSAILIILFLISLGSTSRLSATMLMVRRAKS
jgi:hypothetical protein